MLLVFNKLLSLHVVCLHKVQFHLQVWYHGNWCKSHGQNCSNTKTTDEGGCCIWYNEPQVSIPCFALLLTYFLIIDLVVCFCFFFGFDVQPTSITIRLRGESKTVVLYLDRNAIKRGQRHKYKEDCTKVFVSILCIAT